MDSRTQERVERWDSRPFSGGYDGLRDLVDSDFSGAVTAAGSWLFLLNGRIVGTVDGAVEDFENGSGTIYKAPHPSLPLLCTMEERDGETRAKYYTNETPLREVDRTLQDGSFTGYIELSENVLSGDYYVVYYGGRRMAAAYIGSAERLLTGDEAFERAADEVGIYEVTDVEIDVTDVPGATDPTADSDATDSVDETDEQPASDARSPTADEEPASEPNTDSTTPDADPGVEPVTTDDEAPSATSGITTADESDGPSVDPDVDGSIDPDTAEPETDTDESPLSDANTSADENTQGTTSPDPEAVEAAARKLDRQDIDWVDDESEDEERPDEDELEERFEQEEQWRETRSIPSIDPDNTETTDAETSAGDSRPAARTDAAETRNGSESTRAPSNDESERTSRRSGQTQESNDTSTAAGGDRRAEAARQRERLEKQRTALRSKVEELETERDQLRSKNQELSSTVSRLRSRIEELEAELERARSSGTTEREPAAGAKLSLREALSRTNLFVRYASKSQPTLETAHEGGADRGEVQSNLRLEYHTQFDETDAVVDGEPYEDALASSMAYRFVDWLTSVVLYEIRDTGRADALSDLYDAIPRIDRAELHASISLEDDETDDVPDRIGFDIVAYDKMGNPLLVANLNDSREPASQAMLEEMEEAASAVKANYPDLAAAIVVTSSYFEPGALEVVEQATGGGFLSRGSRLSYVNLSRKQGYHLCLAESRSEGFHMNVPEL